MPPDASGLRSDQSRITDHRIGLTLHNVPAFMDGDIQAMIDGLNQDEQARKLREMTEEE